MENELFEKVDATALTTRKIRITPATAPTAITSGACVPTTANFAKVSKEF